MKIEIQEDSANAKIYYQIENLNDKFNQGIRMGLYFLGKDLIATLSKGMLARNQTGREYRYKGRRIRASRGGATPDVSEYPANRSGNLRKSRDFNVIGYREMIFGVEANYGKFVQEGTSKMEPRFFLNKSVNENHRNAELHFEREIKKVLNG